MDLRSFPQLIVGLTIGCAAAPPTPASPVVISTVIITPRPSPTVDETLPHSPEWRIAAADRRSDRNRCSFMTTVAQDGTPSRMRLVDALIRHLDVQEVTLECH